MLTIVIMLTLAIAFYTGARRGLVLQAVLTAGYIITMFVAKAKYPVIAKKIELLIPYPAPTPQSELHYFAGESLFKLDQAFYGAMGFLIIIMIGWAIMRFVGLLCHQLTFFPTTMELNVYGGGFLSFIVAYLALFMCLMIAAMIPLDGIQKMIEESTISRFIIENTPYFSKTVLDWVNQIIY
ncbi:CvpA family protein [Vagococcus fessus]|uniref:Colicin V production protein CvpA n=1 Tax=Vagococcus fessus TaxID=120370 RepID=A0A430A6G5_9ENTE|nr:CvpA family protein [Vagococcus fessus]RSU02497.1 hypothetical protein CBF31_09015 [Vagococcus fessus]